MNPLTNGLSGSILWNESGRRGVAQWLSASALGAESRGFDPLHPDHFRLFRGTRLNDWV